MTISKTARLSRTRNFEVFRLRGAAATLLKYGERGAAACEIIDEILISIGAATEAQQREDRWNAAMSEPQSKTEGKDSKWT